MAAYFTELNRKRPPAGPLDYVTHTTCPTVHAADDRSVMETLEALRHQIRSTRAFMGDGSPYRIGPSQIGCRENPYGKATGAEPRQRPRLPEPHRSAPARPVQRRLDARLRRRLRARRDRGRRARRPHRAVRPHLPPDRLRPALLRRASTARAVYPAFHVVAGLAALAGAARARDRVSPPAARSRPSRCATAHRTVLWLANLTADGRHRRASPRPRRARASSRSTPTAFEALTRSRRLPGHGRPRRCRPARSRLDAYAVARLEARAPLTIQS